MDYPAGSIVVLKSGGPTMTVVSSNDNDIECVWMNEVGELSRETIPATALEAVETEEDEEEDDDAFAEDGKSQEEELAD